MSGHTALALLHSCTELGAIPTQHPEKGARMGGHNRSQLGLCTLWRVLMRACMTQHNMLSIGISTLLHPLWVGGSHA
jgi:hypothetical protein